MTATLLHYMLLPRGIYAVIVGRSGYWVHDCVTHHEVASDQGGQAYRVFSMMGKARACSCGRRVCVHQACVDEVLKTW